MPGLILLIVCSIWALKLRKVMSLSFPCWESALTELQHLSKSATNGWAHVNPTVDRRQIIHSWWCREVCTLLKRHKAPAPVTQSTLVGAHQEKCRPRNINTSAAQLASHRDMAKAKLAMTIILSQVSLALLPAMYSCNTAMIARACTAQNGHPSQSVVVQRAHTSNKHT